MGSSSGTWQGLPTHEEKSVSTTQLLPLLHEAEEVHIMFSGFTSPCTMPFSWQISKHFIS
jgi:hypothetical protein